MSRESFIGSCLRRSREYGEGIVLADQSISSLKEVAKSNVYTILCLSQSGQKDRREVISVLGLDQRQADVTNRLNEGEGIIRLAARNPYPLLLKFPYIKPKNISDTEIDEMNQKDERVQKLLSCVKKRHNPHASHALWSDQKKEQPQGDKKIDRAKDVLLDIYNRFDVASSQRATDLDLSAEASTRIYKYLEKEMLVEPIRINLSGKKGGLSKYHVNIPKGAEFIGKPPVKKSGGTGAMHAFLERYLKKHLPKRGFTEVGIEKNFCGKRIDVFGVYEGVKIAIEICVSTIYTEFRNVEQDRDKCDCLIIVCPDKKTKDKLEKNLYQKMAPHPKIKICVVHELLNDADVLISDMRCHGSSNL